MLNTTSYGRTDIGKERKKNDDTFLVDDKNGLYGIADGLGGLPHGDVASRVAMEVVRKGLSDGQKEMVPVFMAATEAVMAKGKEFAEELGIATTLTVARIKGDSLHIGHIGDSGVLLIRGIEVKELTKDHTMAQEMKDAAKEGEIVEIPDLYNHILTQCIGTMRELRVQEIDEKLRAGDKIVLYTDGVTKTHAHGELGLMASRCPEPQLLVDMIIKQANDRGGPDNVTAVAIYIS